MQQKKTLTHVEELGMEATGSERTILIGASRCNPCSNLLKYLNGSQLADKSEISLEFYSYDSEKPDLIQTWQPVPDNTNVPGTPTILRVEPDGSISGIITGFSDDPVWLTKLEKFIMREKQNE